MQEGFTHVAVFYNTTTSEQVFFLFGGLELFGNTSLLSDNTDQTSQNVLYKSNQDTIFRGFIPECLATFSCHIRENQSWQKFSAAMAHFLCVAPGMSRRDGVLEYCCSCCCPREETQLALLVASPPSPCTYCNCPTPPSATNLTL